MAKKTALTKRIVVELAEPQEKKHVFRYDSMEDGAAVSVMYVDKAALKEIGNPDKIKVTIEAA